MKRVLLTSTGFENINIKNKFLGLLDKNPVDAKVLFVITAANDPDAVRILSKCLDDLTDCGITDNNITVYDMHKLISDDEIVKYDAIYVCGGSTKHLVNRINEVGFKNVLDKFFDNGGIYIGVSAGSVACGGKYSDGLGLIENRLDVHCDNGCNNGIVDNDDDICLTNNQAIYIDNNDIYIFE